MYSSDLLGVPPPSVNGEVMDGSEEPVPRVRAGWYVDPALPEKRVRYWDGKAWTTHTQPIPAGHEVPLAPRTATEQPSHPNPLRPQGGAERLGALPDEFATKSTLTAPVAREELYECPGCGHAVSAKTRACMACGRPLRRLSRHAVVSALFAAAAVAFLVLVWPWLSAPAAILAVLLGRDALRSSKSNPFARGRPVAIAGISVGLVCLLGALMTFFVFIPQSKADFNRRADAAIENDLSNAAYYQDLGFEQEGKYRNDVYGLAINGWSVSSWDYYRNGTMGFDVDSEMVKTKFGRKQGYCMYAESVSGRVIHYDSDTGIGEGGCNRPSVLELYEQAEADGTLVTERNADHDAEFCRRAAPFVDAALTFEQRARSDDQAGFESSAATVRKEMARLEKSYDRFASVKEYDDAFETYRFYTDFASSVPNARQWNRHRKSSGSDLTRGVIRRTSFTCPDYAALL